LLPTSAQPDSIPFLLVRPALATSSDDVVDDEAETTEIPASKSVPPHTPPARVVTTENDLPSVIVELKEIEVAEVQRASDVDGLLNVSVKLDFPLPVEDKPTIDEVSPTRQSRSRARAGKARGFTIALVAALGAAGGTFAGLKVCHISGGTLGAALHVVR
jgi:carbamoylphosphate synthase large subunit